MARFDVYEGSGPDLLLDCQADELGHFRTRFVVPLLPAEASLQPSRLHPIFAIRGERYVMVTHLASAVHVSDLGSKRADLADQHATIMNALDMLLTGY